MKKPTLAFLTAAVLLASIATQAAVPTTESIDQLLVATQSEKTQESMFANMTQLMRQTLATALKDKPLTIRQQRVMEAAPERFARVMREEMSWDQLRPVYLQIYQESFTQEEVDGLIAFYSSPTGRAFVEKMPLVVQKTMTVMQSRMAPLMQKMHAAIAESVADVEKARPPPLPSASLNTSPTP